MLMLTRRKGETIFIGEDVKVVINDIRGGQVSIGVHAPKNVRIDRKELRVKKDANRQLSEQGKV